MSPHRGVAPRHHAARDGAHPAMPRPATRARREDRARRGSSVQYGPSIRASFRSLPKSRSCCEALTPEAPQDEVAMNVSSLPTRVLWVLRAPALEGDREPGAVEVADRIGGPRRVARRRPIDAEGIDEVPLVVGGVPARREDVEVRV